MQVVLLYHSKKVYVHELPLNTCVKGVPQYIDKKICQLV